MKLIYLCGPVTGTENAVHLFSKVEQKIKNAAARSNIEIHVVNPMRLCESSLSWHKAMRRCVSNLSQCDGIALLNGWQNSKGALLEIKLAQDLHIPVVFIETGERDYLTDLFEAAPESLRYFNDSLTRYYNKGIDESIAECRAEAELVNRYLDPYGFEYIEITEGK